MRVNRGHHEAFERSATDVHLDRFGFEGEYVHTVVTVTRSDHIVGRLFEATVGAWRRIRFGS